MKNVFLIIAIYFSTRLFNLFILPIFTDESSYLYNSLLMKADILKLWDLPLALPVVKPPLFFLVAALIESVVSNVLLAGRLVSVFSGAATLLGLYALTIKFFGNKAAVVTSILYILSPYTLTYDRLALMDSLLSAFSVWILFVAVSYLDKKKIKFLFVLFILCFFSLLTKQSAKFFLLLLPFIPLLMKGKKEVKSCIVLAFVSLLTYFLYLFFLSRSNNFDFYNNFDKNYINFSFQIAVNNFKAILSWTKSYFPIIIICIPISIIYIFKTNFHKGLTLILWAFTPLLASMMVGNYFFPRYLLPSIIFLFPIMALLFNKSIILLVLMLIPSLFFDFNILTNPQKAPYHYNERAQFISEWPSGYGVKEAYDKVYSISGKKRVYIEGDNGQLFSSFNLMGDKLNLTPYKQNLNEIDVIKNVIEKRFDYLLINRPAEIRNQNLINIWSYQRQNEGDKLILYEIKNN